MAIQNKRSLGASLALAALMVSGAALAADAGGMKVVKDPVTGELRGPTPAEAQAMVAQDAAVKTRAVGMLTGAANPQQQVMKNGTVMMELTEDSLVYSVVTRNKDGSLDMQCVTGSNAANNIVNGKTTTKQEHKHDK